MGGCRQCRPGGRRDGGHRRRGHDVACARVWRSMRSEHRCTSVAVRSRRAARDGGLLRPAKCRGALLKEWIAISKQYYYGLDKWLMDGAAV